MKKERVKKERKKEGGPYIREENTGNPTPRVDPLLVAIFLIRSTGEIPLVRCNGVLVRFDAALVAGVDGRAEEVIVFSTAGLLFPAKREVRG